tara:strand:+ start:89 stop:682 length:594 start_codon:yes stop_codon:yes gene_type:complete
MDKKSSNIFSQNKSDKEVNNTNKNDKKKDEISLEEKLKTTEEKLLRSLAEIENQRRRFEKEIKDAFTFGGFNFAKEILALLDNLHRAKLSIKNDSVLGKNKDVEKFLGNIDILEKDLVSIFEKNNIKKINCLGQKFDPNLHQAIVEIEDDKSEPGTIVQEMQAGFMYSDRLLRPSFVGVAKKNISKNNENDKKNVNK